MPIDLTDYFNGMVGPNSGQPAEIDPSSTQPIPLQSQPSQDASQEIPQMSAAAPEESQSDRFIRQANEYLLNTPEMRAKKRSEEYYGHGLKKVGTTLLDVLGGLTGHEGQGDRIRRQEEKAYSTVAPFMQRGLASEEANQAKANNLEATNTRAANALEQKQIDAQNKDYIALRKLDLTKESDRVKATKIAADTELTGARKQQLQAETQNLLDYGAKNAPRTVQEALGMAKNPEATAALNKSAVSQAFDLSGAKRLGANLADLTTGKGAGGAGGKSTSGQSSGWHEAVVPNQITGVPEVRLLRSGTSRSSASSGAAAGPGAPDEGAISAIKAQFGLPSDTPNATIADAFKHAAGITPEVQAQQRADQKKISEVFRAAGAVPSPDKPLPGNTLPMASIPRMGTAAGTPPVGNKTLSDGTLNPALATPMDVFTPYGAGSPPPATRFKGEDLKRVQATESAQQTADQVWDLTKGMTPEQLSRQVGPIIGDPRARKIMDTLGLTDTKRALMSSATQKLFNEELVKFTGRQANDRDRSAIEQTFANVKDPGEAFTAKLLMLKLGTAYEKFLNGGLQGKFVNRPVRVELRDSDHYPISVITNQAIRLAKAYKAGKPIPEDAFDMDKLYSYHTDSALNDIKTGKISVRNR